MGVISSEITFKHNDKSTNTPSRVVMSTYRCVVCRFINTVLNSIAKNILYSTRMDVESFSFIEMKSEVSEEVQDVGTRNEIPM